MVHKTGSTIDASYSYKLDANGRRTNAVEIVLEKGVGGYLTNTLRWQYDGMYRLTNEVSLCSSNTFSYTNQYAYTIGGNRFAKTTIAGSTVTTTNLFDANDELLREVAKTGAAYTETNNYAYDANGSMIGRTNATTTGQSTNVYACNLMNKLSSVTSATIAGTTTTGFQYSEPEILPDDANNHTGYQQALEEFTTLGSTPSRSYVIGDDVLAQADTGSASYLLYDGHGSTRQVSDGTGSVTSQYNYDAYGTTQSTSTAVPETSMLYCGEQYDSGLGMYNLRARYYNANNGRFNQRDTYAGLNEDPQSLHKYAYCDCDPANHTDPSGMFSFIEIMVSTLIDVIGFAMRYYPTVKPLIDWYWYLTIAEIFVKACLGRPVSTLEWINLGVATTFFLLSSAGGGILLAKLGFSWLTRLPIGPALKSYEWAKIVIGGSVRIVEIDETVANFATGLEHLGGVAVEGDRAVIYIYKTTSESENVLTLFHEYGHYLQWCLRGRPAQAAWEALKPVRDELELQKDVFEKLAQIIYKLCK